MNILASRVVLGWSSFHLFEATIHAVSSPQSSLVLEGIILVRTLHWLLGPCNLAAALGLQTKRWEAIVKYCHSHRHTRQKFHNRSCSLQQQALQTLSAPPLSCLASSWKTVLNKERKEVSSLENHWPFEFNTHWKEPAFESNFQIYPCISPNFLVLIHLVLHHQGDTTGFQ